MPARKQGLRNSGRTVRTTTLRNKKIKTPPPHKINLNFYGNRTSGTFGVAATLKANPQATPKEPLFAITSNGALYIHISNFEFWQR